MSRILLLGTSTPGPDPWPLRVTAMLPPGAGLVVVLVPCPPGARYVGLAVTARFGGRSQLVAVEPWMESHQAVSAWIGLGVESEWC
jgi:hypothetical protein